MRACFAPTCCAGQERDRRATTVEKSLSQTWCSHSNTIYDVQLQQTTHAAVAPTNFDAAITMRSADIELQNPTELSAKALKLQLQKPDLDAKGKKTILKHFLKKSLKRKITSAKIETIC